MLLKCFSRETISSLLPSLYTKKNKMWSNTFDWCFWWWHFSQNYIYTHKLCKFLFNAYNNNNNMTPTFWQQGVHQNFWIRIFIIAKPFLTLRFQKYLIITKGAGTYYEGGSDNESWIVLIKTDNILRSIAEKIAKLTPLDSQLIVMSEIKEQ